MNKKIRVAVTGYGNIGKYAIDAVKKSPDMELAGIVRRKSAVNDVLNMHTNIPIVSDICELEKPDVALLCCPSRLISEIAEQYLKLGINTVDSFDIHGEPLWNLRKQLDETGKKYNSVAIISAGWDPGSDSVIRFLLESMEPNGITYTNFGPGMSMGHTVVAKSKKGVRNALSITIPEGKSVHSRLIYVELEPDGDFYAVEKDIKSDDYFVKDNTTVKQVDDVNALINTQHGVLIERKTISDSLQHQFFEFRMKINNPELTAQIMVSCGRATMRQKYGAYTMPEIPVIDLLPGDREMLIKKMV